MNLTSVPASPIRPIGANVTLICTVELSPFIDVPVAINAELFDPTGRSLTINPLLVSGSTYTMTAEINSFGRNQSGIYSCSISLTSTSLFLTGSRPKTASNHITVGKNLFFTIFRLVCTF